MDRNEAIELIKQHVPNQNLIKHMIAVGAIMKGVAEKLGEDENKWEICGILHDIDYEQTKDSHEKHALVGAQMLEGKVGDDVTYAIKAHNYEHTGCTPKSKMDIALIASDALSGLIIATALIHPDKKVELVKVKSVIKKFKQKDFAKNVDRNKIKVIEKIGIPFNEFIEIGIKSLINVADELGL